MAMGEPPPPLRASYESTTRGSAFSLLLSLHSSKLTTSSACRRATPLDRTVRVASGAFLEDANAPILSFQTVEYEQSDMASLDGLWCVFLLKSNKH